MNKFQILDCTLRDGGYINDFHFGKRSIARIISKLTDAGIDIVECGFLENGIYDEETSVFNSVKQIEPFIPQNRKKTMFVAMACYGEYDIDQLDSYDGKSIEGIRVTFHYNEVDEALKFCKKIKDLGYKVFVQPVGTTCYSDEQLIYLIKKVNAIQPYAFYLVDTLGLMHQSEVTRLFYLIDHNLGKNIRMGFHSHNNLQLSFSNCQTLISLDSDRVVSLDSSVYGMGRGAGNLNTELIANYLNERKHYSYEIEPLLEIVDEYIVQIKAKKEWGYSVPYYLAAINGCHPNYASYLSGKQTLTVQGIASILKMIEHEKRALFDKNLVEEKYLEFQSNEIDDADAINTLFQLFHNRNIVLLAPGPSISKYIKKIRSVIETYQCIVVATSFVPEAIKTDFVFLSNKKRYETTFNVAQTKINLIHTSNIKIENDVENIVINYASLLDEKDIIRDNTSVMLLNLLKKLNPRKIFLAGMDGFKNDGENYYHDCLRLPQNKDYISAINEAMTIRLHSLSTNLSIEFITPSLYNV